MRGLTLVVPATLIAGDEELHREVNDAIRPLLSRSDDDCDAPRILVLRILGPLPNTDSEWDSGLGAQLLFCFVQCKRWISSASSRNLLICVLADSTPCAEIGVAALRTFARSLQIEAGCSGRRISFIATDDLRGLESLIAACLTDAPGHGLALDLRMNQETHSFETRAHLTGTPSGGLAVVTGAARGLGFAIASQLAKQGHALVLADIDAPALAKASTSLAKLGCPVQHVSADVRRRTDVEQIAQATSTFGGPTLWINNAGTSATGYVSDLASTAWSRVLETNLRGAIYGTRVALECMQSNGAIINISSTAAYTAGLVHTGCYNAYSPYAASKAAINALSRVAGILGARRNIRVNAVAPGPIRTELLERVYSSEQIQALASHTPAGRIGDPGDVAAAVSYLCSPQASFVNGHVLIVDGGLTIAGGAAQ